MNIAEKNTCSETTRTGKERTFASIANEFSNHIDGYCYKPGITVRPSELISYGIPHEILFDDGISFDKIK